MILDDKEIKTKALRKFYKSDCEKAAGLPQEHLDRLKVILVELQNANSLHDIATGCGARKRFHQYKEPRYRYSLDVSGNVRVTFDCKDPATGVVTNIRYGDPH